MAPQVGAIEALHPEQKIFGILEGVDEITAAAAIAQPAVGDTAGNPQFLEAVLDLVIPPLALLDRLAQARVGHEVKDMPHGLRIVGREGLEYLIIEHFDLRSGAAPPFYRASLIKARRAHGAPPSKMSSTMPIGPLARPSDALVKACRSVLSEQPCCKAIDVVTAASLAAASASEPTLLQLKKISATRPSAKRETLAGVLQVAVHEIDQLSATTVRESLPSRYPRLPISEGSNQRREPWLDTEALGDEANLKANVVGCYNINARRQARHR